MKIVKYRFLVALEINPQNGWIEKDKHEIYIILSKLLEECMRKIFQNPSVLQNNVQERRS